MKNRDALFLFVVDMSETLIELMNSRARTMQRVKTSQVAAIDNLSQLKHAQRNHLEKKTCIGQSTSEKRKRNTLFAEFAL